MSVSIENPTLAQANYLAKGIALDIPAGRAPNANEILVTGAITV